MSLMLEMLKKKERLYVIVREKLAIDDNVVPLTISDESPDNKISFNDLSDMIELFNNTFKNACTEVDLRGDHNDRTLLLGQFLAMFGWSMMEMKAAQYEKTKHISPAKMAKLLK